MRALNNPTIVSVKVIDGDSTAVRLSNNTRRAFTLRNLLTLSRFMDSEDREEESTSPSAGRNSTLDH